MGGGFKMGGCGLVKVREGDSSSRFVAGTGEAGHVGISADLSALHFGARLFAEGAELSLVGLSQPYAAFLIEAESDLCFAVPAGVANQIGKRH